MSNTPSHLGQLVRIAARAHITPLLLVLSACSGSPVSLGSGLDTQESALTETPNGTEDCVDNPLGPGCPTASGTEDCVDNPLLPGCPAGDGMEVDCADNPLLPGCPRG